MNFTVQKSPRAVGGGALKPELTTTAWIVEGSLELRDWLEYGRRFGTLGRGVAWWIGDWLRYGNAAYGERYARAARATGYDAQSLMNMTYVASRFEPTRRRDRLSWSHHAELAALAPSDQEHWLDLAQRHRMSVHALRLELRSNRRAARHALGDADATAATVGAPQVVCPNCQHLIEVEESARRRRQRQLQSAQEQVVA